MKTPQSVTFVLVFFSLLFQTKCEWAVAENLNNFVQNTYNLSILRRFNEKYAEIIPMKSV